MFSGSTHPPQTPTAYPTSPAVSQVTSNWTIGNTTSAPNASHRHTMMFLDSRPVKTEVPTSRPLSMTAMAGPRHLGFQNPQGEYLPQPQMPRPTVRHPSMTQASIVQSTINLNSSSLLYHVLTTTIQIAGSRANHTVTLSLRTSSKT